jgi:hypothetical protein
MDVLAGVVVVVVVFRRSAFTRGTFIKGVFIKCTFAILFLDAVAIQRRHIYKTVGGDVWWFCQTPNLIHGSSRIYHVY